jgi:hypothetical protein
MQKRKFPLIDQLRHLKKYLILAGIKVDSVKIFAILFGLSAIIDLSVLVYFIFKIWVSYESMLFIIVVSFFILTFGYIFIFLVVWLLFLLIIDYLKFKRKNELEQVLPEFLRLVSTNHRSGMAMDISIWKANRPRFGVLSEEINEVARKTYATGDLVQPLKEFSIKYDSNMLKRVISNLIEGLKSGADISKLLDDVASNITTIQNTRKDLASEVENYMLFIIITVLVISPLMFGLTHKLSGLIENVKNILAESIGEESEVTTQIDVNIKIDKEQQEFKIYFDRFVYLMIATNSVVSVLLMSMVKYGNVKQDLKRIPVFYVVAIVVYHLSKMMFAGFLPI